jgi:acyl-coenzyme A synthetase/AMP-(fatty) acid ligase
MKPTRFTPEMIRDFLSKGYWTNETTSETWDRNAELFGLEEAMVDSTRRLTWNDFKRKSDTLAMNFLEMGFQKDDIFFILLPNCVDAYITKLACEKAGIICIASLMTLRENEIEDILKTYDVKAIIIPEKFKSFNCYEAIKSMKPNLPKLEYIFCTGYNVPEDTHSVECLYHKQPKKKYDLSKTRLKVDELGALGLTSGTTGVPKVAEHTIGERVALWNSYVKKMDLKKSDVVLNVLNPVTGSCGYYSAKDGAKRVVMDIWDAKEALRLIEEERVTAIITTPAQLSMLIKEAGEGNYDTSSLRVILAGTAPMTPELAMACEQKLGVILVNSYGSMDGGGISNVSIYDDENTRYYTAGKVHLGNEIKIVDDDGNEVPKGEEGELILREPSLAVAFLKTLKKQ